MTKLGTRPAPCPFCGHADPHMSFTNDGEWFIACDRDECHALGPTGVTPDQALANWNHRDDPDETEDDDAGEGE